MTFDLSFSLLLPLTLSISLFPSLSVASFVAMNFSRRLDNFSFFPAERSQTQFFGSRAREREREGESRSVSKSPAGGGERERVDTHNPPIIRGNRRDGARKYTHPVAKVLALGVRFVGRTGRRGMMEQVRCGGVGDVGVGIPVYHIRLRGVLVRCTGTTYDEALPGGWQ